jgi:sulfate transport system ATP-binding protein
LIVHPVEDGRPAGQAIEGTVTRVTHLGFEVRVDVDLSSGGDCWAQLSRGTAAELGLEAGQVVWVARVEAVAERAPILSA